MSAYKNCVKWAYKIITNEKIIGFTRKIYHVFLKIIGEKKAHIITEKNRFLYYEKLTTQRSLDNNELIYEEEKALEVYAPLVSVIVPNYNHVKYLRQRLESIYNQTYNKFEVILLDDASTDESVEVLKEYQSKYSEKTTLVINDQNSGNTFKQWKKGLEIAKGELVWIAESDDYCELNLLEKLIPTFRYQSVRIGFCPSIFVRDGKTVWSTQEYLVDTIGINWNEPFMISAADLVKSAFTLHNVIANVSSAIIRNYNGIAEELNDSTNMKLSGDWLFYLKIIRGGTVAYTVETHNYYRVHEQSTSLKIQKTERYYQEFEQVSCYIAKSYKVDFAMFEKNLDNLKSHYRTDMQTQTDEVVEKWYSLSEIQECVGKRKLNIAFAIYATKSGGGEIYPIYLANEMRKRGYNVSIINFRFEPTQKNVLDRIEKSVPYIDILELENVAAIIKKMDIDVVHSHHANVDEALAILKNELDLKFKHVVTLHGLYEMLPQERAGQIIQEVIKECNKFIYIAEKNKLRFEETGNYDPAKFVKIVNGVPNIDVKKITREDIGLKKYDFVIALASRALPEKGWKVAIDAVEALNERYNKRIVLLLLGEGEERQRWKYKECYNIRFLGNSNYVKSFFAIADLTILPSTYEGESVPLVVIESLQMGTPVVATDIGEIREQLDVGKQSQAGLLIPLQGKETLTANLEEEISKCIDNPKLLQKLRKNTALAAVKFDFDKIIDKHIHLYNEIMNI